MTLRIVSVSLALAVAACQTPTSSTPPAEPVATAAEPPVVGPPDVAWSDMTKEQKGRYMKEVVMAQVSPMLTAFDAHEFDKVTCKTCHGADAKERGFEMPNPGLTELPATPAGWEALAEAKPEAVKFMSEQLKPKMATLLGVPEFDPTKPEEGGFGCMACHTVETP